MLCILSFCHLNLLDPWHLSPIYLHLGWVSRHYSLYGPSVYRFNIDPDIAALGRGGGLFHILFLNQSHAIDPDVIKHFFGFLLDSRGREGQTVASCSLLRYASLARGFLIFFRIPMCVVKNDWNPHLRACRKRRLCRKKGCLTCLFHYPAFIHICLLGRVHPWRVWLAKQETLTPPGHLVSPLVLGRNQGS